MVGICDETPRGWNAVFCFWDPRLAHVSPGIANILALVDLARARGQRHVHLGYRVSGCPSLGYKAAFHAQEVLTGLPTDDEAPRWRLASATAGAGEDPGSRGRS
jgi:arginine-tRNA-protein transferase